MHKKYCLQEIDEMLHFKRKGATAKTLKSETKIAEDSFSKIILKKKCSSISLLFLILPSDFLHIAITVSEKRTVLY